MNTFCCVMIDNILHFTSSLHGSSKMICTQFYTFLPLILIVLYLNKIQMKKEIWGIINKEYNNLTLPTSMAKTSTLKGSNNKTEKIVLLPLPIVLGSLHYTSQWITAEIIGSQQSACTALGHCWQNVIATISSIFSLSFLSPFWLLFAQNGFGLGF